MYKECSLLKAREINVMIDYYILVLWNIIYKILILYINIE